MKKRLASVIALSLVAIGNVPSVLARDNTPAPVTINFGSYSVTQNVYTNGIFPAFEKYWKQKTGQTVTFNASFQASGSEARAIASGLPVDVAALSTADDITKIVAKHLITSNWQATPYSGIVTDSIVAFAVRKGNPKNIHDWSDLTKSGVIVDMPNPSTSGGAKWDISAIYGAGLKEGGPAKSKQLLSGIYHNVQKLDTSGEISMTTFTQGFGDVAISYENQILDASHNLKDFTEVIPKDTLLIENPVALVDKNAAKDGTTTVDKAFINFLQSDQGQEIFVQYGFRAIRPDVAKKTKSKYTVPAGLFTVHSLGSWSNLNNVLYSPHGLWTQVLEGK